MANFVYGKAKESLFKGQINLVANQLKVLLIDNSLYSPSASSDAYVSDVPVLAIKGRSNAVQNISFNIGTIDADDIVITNYSGQAFSALIGYQVGSSDADSRLIFYVDTATGLPFGGSSSSTDVTISWSNEVSKIISL